jgi:hypothetical protein
MAWKALKHHKRYEISTRGKIRNISTKKHIKQVLSATGKVRVYLDGYKLSLYRLIAKAFIDNNCDYKANFVKDASKYLATSDGRIYSLYVKRFLKPAISGAGYEHVVLTQDDGSTKNADVHRVIALTLIYNQDEDRDVVNHIDHIKLNNNTDNLEWTTTGGNNRAYRDHALYSKSSSSGSNGNVSRGISIATDDIYISRR